MQLENMPTVPRYRDAARFVVLAQRFKEIFVV
jgi:hypothetical protein